MYFESKQLGKEPIKRTDKVSRALLAENRMYKNPKTESEILVGTTRTTKKCIHMIEDITCGFVGRVTEIQW